MKGKYCPTTCGVADYLHRYKPDVDRQLDQMEQDLEEIANLTRGAQDKVVYLKDSETQAQKQSPGSTLISFIVEKYINTVLDRILYVNADFF